MVLECVTGGDLFDRIVSKGKLSETQGRKMFQQLIDGVSYCHNKGVFHRDLKLENVLLDAKGHIKITDFGLSALSQHYRPYIQNLVYTSAKRVSNFCLVLT
jgi:5'-AMP-activated protein kinase catalytic alpha subunit